MPELTHAEWELLDNATTLSNLDANEVKSWHTVMEKLHPMVSTTAECGHDCQECFKRCHGYYPGEPHHSGKANCPKTIQLAQWKAENYEGEEDEVLTDECTCECRCVDDKHETMMNT